MLLKLKNLWIAITAIAAIALPACSPGSGLVETAAVSTVTPSPQFLKTTMGDFAIASTRLVDEVHDSKAPNGSKFLLVGLAQPDLQKLVPGEFSLETFQSMIMDNHDEIYILGKDGSQTFYSQMAGWVEDDFVIGFTVPLAESYTLHWPENSPIPLDLKK